MADAGYVLFKPVGPRWAAVIREVFGAAQTIFLIFSMASHILTWTICLNTLTNGTACTIAWGIVGLVIFWICDIPRTLQKVSWLSCVSFLSITTAMIVCMARVGARNPSHGNFHATQTANFATAFLSVTNIVFTYAGHVAFFIFISEMRNPGDFPKALALLQVTDTAMYFLVAMVVYAYGGDQVDSPALGPAGTLIGKVAWGLAITPIIVAGCRLQVHLCSSVPWYEAHVTANALVCGQLAYHHLDGLGHRMDHRGIYTQLQRLAGSDFQSVCLVVHLWHLGSFLVVHEPGSLH
jgi:hypothetical protein